ncbi:hypothetical protein EON63_07715 [archaeon]|nr:MAG: hypothetical protein EON63_07715 [archaeon]
MCMHMHTYPYHIHIHIHIHIHSDATLNEVLVVLKMLYLKDLRGLQDEINQLMMLCQNTTANP